MAIEPIFENIKFNEKNKLLSKQIKLECKTEIPTDTVDKVLDVNVFLGYPDSICEEKKISYSGKAVFNVVYQNVEGALCKCECISDYDGEFNADTISGANVWAKVEKTGYDLSGTKLILNAIYVASAKVYVEKEIVALKDGKDFVTDKCDKTISKSFGVRQGNFPIEEVFTVEYEIAEVLSRKATANITNVQCGVGCIIVDGEVNATALLLQNVEKSDIIREEKNIPFRIELEYEDAMPQLSCIADCFIKSLKSDIAVDDEKSKSEITVTVNTCFIGEVFAEETVSLVNDLFSTSVITEIQKESFCYQKLLESRNVKTKVTERCAVDIPEDARLMAVGGEKTEVTDIQCSNGKIKVTGVISLKGYFRGVEGGNFTLGLEIPFSEETECNLDKDVYVEVKGEATSGSVKIVTLNEAEVSCDLCLMLYFTQKCQLEYIKEIEEKGEKPQISSAISVYIPTEGEELWSLSKRLNVEPETLVQTNKELCFPLTGKERIVIYRQK